jgi:hypothetical protein
VAAGEGKGHSGRLVRLGGARRQDRVNGCIGRLGQLLAGDLRYVQFRIQALLLDQQLTKQPQPGQSLQVKISRVSGLALVRKQECRALTAVFACRVSPLGRLPRGLAASISSAAAM